MKTTILTSVFAVLVSIMNLNAKETKTYSNVGSNESGITKEYITLEGKTLVPQEKVCYFYDKKGKILTRTLSIWDKEKGWINCGIHKYQYNEVNKLASMTYTKWNNNKEKWSEKMDMIIYLYGDNNELLSVKQIKEVNNTDNINDLITLK
ncbi:DUF3836 domain-containing protein [Dysgonomonas sp. Marseille-P4677]|uniref:DUF3836 domain-containing protein n=1 Tax=Dysgonomonas sp. Marseille-P4677 TaxID=2364790 RepID=UPI0019138A2E|nr:DUF3836 domain-containing protein [Dysgonomonas sp. Marseille-P4677]MBK5719298.1 DUF3836 domain-containing protein [Dysgonomonas sp. Marseille-P4677]